MCALIAVRCVLPPFAQPPCLSCAIWRFPPSSALLVIVFFFAMLSLLRLLLVIFRAMQFAELVPFAPRSVSHVLSQVFALKHIKPQSFPDSGHH